MAMPVESYRTNTQSEEYGSPVAPDVRLCESRPAVSLFHKAIVTFVQRLLDLALTTVAMIVLAPLFAVISILIKLDTRGPVLFRQRRVGKDGIEFTCYKFRSMVVNAEDLKEQLVPHNDGGGLLFKLHNDPRVTRTGRWLRRLSLDELPQLYNVLIGQMSLVGPRPALPCEVAKYTDRHRRRLAVAPGLTGLWQVSGRSDLPFETGMDLDIYYVDNQSIVLYFVIIIQSVPAVLVGKGAY
jgi:lipopolysaccharide/colanic/teichoic acid biosynthesis glycosyltransferase